MEEYRSPRRNTEGAVPHVCCLFLLQPSGKVILHRVAGPGLLYSPRCVFYTTQALSKCVPLKITQTLGLLKSAAYRSQKMRRTPPSFAEIQRCR